MRAIYIVLDSLGVGGAQDAAHYGDEGSNTLGHIALACLEGKADVDGLRAGPLHIPNLTRLGLGHSLNTASGLDVLKVPRDPQGFATSAQETSKGKDTPSGHFEMTGVPVPFDWQTYPKTVPAFPNALMARIIEDAKLPGILGNCHASGTQIIAELGDEHIQSGKPIFYTSADSVIQIAAHETHFGLENLYHLCEMIRSYEDLVSVGRIIARPFLGDGKDQPYKRTYNRRDFAQPCPGENLLDKAVAAHIPVTAIGKVGDIFAHRGITKVVKAGGNPAITDALIAALHEETGPGIIFANLVDFDSEFGHRRNVPGYAKALEDFDKRIPEIEAALRMGDVAVMTADHGNDPTWEGSDHTREQIPAVFFGPSVAGGVAPARNSFADIGQTFAQHLRLDALAHGQAIF